MISSTRFEALKAQGDLPSPAGVSIRVIQLTRQDDVTNLEVAAAIKTDPALSSRIIKVANAKVAYQTRPIASIVDAVAVLGLSTVRQLVLGLSLIDSGRPGACKPFDYQNFWAHSLLTAITAQNLVLASGIGSVEEVFILGLLAKIGSLALATACPNEYARILGQLQTDARARLTDLEQTEFAFDHNQLTQAMLADWGLPRVFQQIALYHETPEKSGYPEDSRDWRLLHVLHVSDYFASVCLARGSQRRKMVPRLILIATSLGVELDALARLGDKSVQEWREWGQLCAIHTVEAPPFAELLEAVPQVPSMLEETDSLPTSTAGNFYPLRILLVDDDQAIALLLKRLLEIAGHTVSTARSALQGLEMIQEFKPQLIITDWVMPGMDGIDFCKALRQTPAWRNIYVFIMTAQEGVDRLVAAFDAGANDFMTKPLNPKMLVARLRAAQRVVQLQEEMEFDRQQLHTFADELAATNHRLRKSDVSMRAILDNSPYMSWLKDADGYYIKVNKAYADHTPQSDGTQIIGKTDFDLWPGERAAKYRDEDAAVMRSRQQKCIEDSFLDGDQVRWYETFKTPVIDDNGNVLGTTGFARDITERKQAEAGLRLSATAFESREGMLVTDENNVILRANQAFSEITGYSTEEIVGQTPAILRSGRHDSDFYARMWKSLERSGLWQGEIWNRRKNGEIFPERLTITAVKGASGQVTNYVATLHDITERKRMEKKIVTLAFYDPLTELPNRRLLNDRLGRSMAASKRHGRYGALMFMDLDNFKPLNDMYGHGAGDLLLVEVAHRISACVRETDTVARFGGDEFVVVLSDLDKNKNAAIAASRLVAEKIRNALSEPYQLVIRHKGRADSTVEHQCTSSIGVVLFIDQETEKEDLLKWADRAMYQAKEDGRNLIRFFDQQTGVCEA